MGLNKRLIDQVGGAAGGLGAATDNFDIVTYTGNGSTQSITSLDFQPDLVWVKPRSFADNHVLSDSVRGVNKSLASNATSSENSLGITSFDSNGFSLPQWGNVTSNGNDFVAWCWKAGGSVTPNNNTNGTITSTVSANPDAGFSIVSYTGNGATGQTVGHGLNSSPEFIIVKSRNTVATTDSNWTGYHKDLTAGYKILLNENSASGSSGNWANTNPTNNVFYVLSGDSGTNANGGDFIAYCFHSVDGYQKVGSYTGTGTSGNVVTTGFQPRFIMYKRADSTGNWIIHDSERNTTSALKARLYPNLSDAEQVVGTQDVNLLSNGFEMITTGSDGNANGGTYIYLAIA